MKISNNIKKLREEISTLNTIHNTKHTTKILAVTKTATNRQIQEAINSGVHGIAENRVSSAEKKFPFIDNVEKHMIGHLQRNKVKRAIRIFDVIQSVDSLRLAKEISKRAKDENKIMKIMLQVNTSGEEQKFGLSEDEVEENYKKIIMLENIKVVGLMMMAPLVQAEETREYFSKANIIREKLKLKEFSAGMTNDYKVAIEEGSTMIRMGRAIFNQSL